MAKLSLLVILSSLILAVVLAEQQWPDTSCHKVYHNARGATNQAYHRKKWGYCEKDLERNGKPLCLRICQLNQFQIVNLQFGSKGPPIFYPEKAVHYMDRENGYREGGGRAEDRLLDGVKGQMDLCNIKFNGTIHELSIDESCERWNDFIQCVDTAYKHGCPPGRA